MINTTMWLENGTHITFINNTASEVGGAIQTDDNNHADNNTHLRYTRDHIFLSTKFLFTQEPINFIICNI